MTTRSRSPSLWSRRNERFTAIDGRLLFHCDSRPVVSSPLLFDFSWNNKATSSFLKRGRKSFNQSAAETIDFVLSRPLRGVQRATRKKIKKFPKKCGPDPASPERRPPSKAQRVTCCTIFPFYFTSIFMTFFLSHSRDLLCLAPFFFFFLNK